MVSRSLKAWEFGSSFLGTAKEDMTKLTIVI